MLFLKIKITRYFITTYIFQQNKWHFYGITYIYPIKMLNPNFCTFVGTHPVPLWQPFIVCKVTVGQSPTQVQNWCSSIAMADIFMDCFSRLCQKLSTWSWKMSCLVTEQYYFIVWDSGFSSENDVNGWDKLGISWLH